MKNIITILAICIAISTLTGIAFAKGDHLLITEVSFTPTPSEFIEIFNPSTTAAVNLENYYLADHGSYWMIVNNSQINSTADFFARFPTSSIIPPMGTIVVSLAGNTSFNGYYGGSTVANFELVNTDGTPDMLPAQPGSIGATASITNAGECVILYSWNGVSDLVQDVDMVNAGQPAAANAISQNSKAGQAIDGPDGDVLTTAYPANAYTMGNMTFAGAIGTTANRKPDKDEGTEAVVNGSGITGDDETSENTGATWLALAPTPGVPGIVPVVLSRFETEIIKP